MDEIEQELKLGFLDEAEQLVLDTENSFFKLEKTGLDAKVIERLFRLTHTLKGASKAAGFNHLSDFARQIEALLSRVKLKKSSKNTQLISLLMMCNDRIYYMVEQLKLSFDAQFNNTDLIKELEETLNRNLAEEQAVAAQQLADETDKHLQTAMNRSPEKDERLTKVIDRMIVLRALFDQRRAEMDSEVFQRKLFQFERLSKEIEDLSLELRQQSLGTTFQQLEKTFSESSKALGKEVKFVLSGTEARADKAVLDQVWNPLVHLVGNALFHGLETSSEDRKKSGKSPVGTIFLSASQGADQIGIEVRDDGSGLSYPTLPGWLESVRSKITQLQGEIQIQSVKNQGTTIKIVLPRFLAVVS